MYLHSWTNFSVYPLIHLGKKNENTESIALFQTIKKTETETLSFLLKLKKTSIYLQF